MNIACDAYHFFFSCSIFFFGSMSFSTYFKLIIIHSRCSLLCSTIFFKFYLIVNQRRRKNLSTRCRAMTISEFFSQCENWIEWVKLGEWTKNNHIECAMHFYGNIFLFVLITMFIFIRNVNHSVWLCTMCFECEQLLSPFQTRWFFFVWNASQYLMWKVMLFWYRFFCEWTRARKMDKSKCSILSYSETLTISYLFYYM